VPAFSCSITLLILDIINNTVDMKIINCYKLEKQKLEKGIGWCAGFVLKERSICQRVCPDAPGQRHEPGTWTRGRRLTEKKAIISLSFEQRDFSSGC